MHLNQLKLSNPLKIIFVIHYYSKAISNTYNYRFLCQNLKFTIISDRKAISSLLHHSLSGLEFIFNHFFTSKLCRHSDRALIIAVCGLRFKSIKIEPWYFKLTKQTYNSRELHVFPG